MCILFWNNFFKQSEINNVVFIDIVCSFDSGFVNFIDIHSLKKGWLKCSSLVPYMEPLRGLKGTTEGS